jgi:hypothetical protein
MLFKILKYFTVLHSLKCVCVCVCPAVQIMIQMITTKTLITDESILVKSNRMCY